MMVEGGMVFEPHQEALALQVDQQDELTGRERWHVRKVRGPVR
jgi:hypothetical protein